MSAMSSSSPASKREGGVSVDPGLLMPVSVISPTASSSCSKSSSAPASSSSSSSFSSSIITSSATSKKGGVELCRTDDEGLSEGSRSPSSCSLSSGSVSSSPMGSSAPTATKQPRMSRQEKMMLMSKQHQQPPGIDDDEEGDQSDEEGDEDEEATTEKEECDAVKGDGGALPVPVARSLSWSRQTSSDSLSSMVPAAPLLGGTTKSTGNVSDNIMSTSLSDTQKSQMSKKELRMLKNRESAARSRKRKRDMMERLELGLGELRQHNAQLQTKLNRYIARYGELIEEEGDQQGKGEAAANRV